MPSDLSCSWCDHPYASHFAGGTCLVVHRGVDGSTCPCLAWSTTAPPAPAPLEPVKAARVSVASEAPSGPREGTDGDWVTRGLSCSGCGRVTYRTPLAREGCVWCGGALSPAVAVMRFDELETRHMEAAA